MILKLIICRFKKCCSELVLSWMETKFGVQTLHGKYYLRIKPRCSGNFWSSKTKETTLVKFIRFSGTSQSHCAQAGATVLSQDQVNLGLEGATWSFLKYHSKFGLYSVKSVIARSKLSFSYGCNGGNLMERFVRHHTTT